MEEFRRVSELLSEANPRVMLEFTVNTSSQLENSVRYHFQVVFTSGELGNFKASPFVPLGVLDLVRSLFGPKYAEMKYEIC